MERGEFAGTRRIWKTSRQLLLEENFGGVTSGGAGFISINEFGSPPSLESYKKHVG